MLKNRPFWFSVALSAAYLLAAWLAMPYWLQPRLEQYVKLQWGRQLQFEKLLFDPLTWSADLTGVRLAEIEPEVRGELGVLPGLGLTAESVHLRFNFWRLQPAVSTLLVKAPILTIDGSSTLMQSGHYPFVSLWQQWQSQDRAGREHQLVPIQRWRLEAGRMELAYPGRQKSEILLDQLLMQAGEVNIAGQRDYRLAFTTVAGATIKMQGEFDGITLDGRGHYHWVTTQPGIYPQFEAAGEFSAAAQGDLFRIELAKSHLTSEQLGRCALDGLLCAGVRPLDSDFSASLLVSIKGAQLLAAQLQQGAFELDASLGQESILLAEQVKFESASLRISSVGGSAGRAVKEGLASATLEFDLTMQEAGGRHWDTQGLYHPDSEQVVMRFTAEGEPQLRGHLQAQWVEADEAVAGYPQVELQLENRAARLAQGFIVEHRFDQVSAAALHFGLNAKLKDQELRVSEHIRLQQVAISPANGRPELLQDTRQGIGQSSLTAEPARDLAWLLALLQNPQSDVVLVIPEQTISRAEQVSLRNLTESSALAVIDRVMEQPFEELALQMSPQGQDLAVVQFESGSAELNASSSENLQILAQALLQRPGLGLALAGVYDPLIDLKALQTEQVSTHIGLATAADLAFQSGSKRPDFTDPLVHSVIDEFTRRRLPAEVLEAFVRHFGEADVDRGVIPEGDIAAYYSALFELLVDHAEIPQSALVTLARYRAQAVAELLARQGVARDRLMTAAEPHISSAEMTGVPLQLELVIHHGKDPGLPENSSPERKDQEYQGKLD